MSERATTPATATATTTATTTIGLVSDTHFWPRSRPVITSDGALQLQPWSEQLLSTLIAELEAAQVDLVIHLGDLTCGGGTYAMPPEEFVATMRTVRQRLQTLSAPVVALSGNHDARPGNGDLSEFCELWQNEAGLGKTIDLPQARLILLNTTGYTPEQVAAAPDGDPVYGWVGPAELDRLDAALATAGGRPVLLFTHQLLQRWAGDQVWHDYFGVRNAADVLQVIERRGGVRAVFQGHAHRFDLHTRSLGGDPECLFAVMPAIIEYPVAWVRLQLSATQAECTLQRLPLAGLAALSEQSGGGQSWRQGDPAWWSYQFSLA